MKKIIQQILLSVFFLTINASLFSQINKEKTQQWQQFEAKYGSTIIDWKETTQTPHRVICHPIKLANAIHNAEQLEGLLRDFMSENNAIFQLNNQQLKVQAIQKVRKVWYATFIQTHQNLTVLDSEIIFRVHENGNLFLFGLDTYSINSLTTNSKNSNIIKNNIRQKYDYNNLTIKQFDTEKILPIYKNGTFTFKKVFEFLVTNQQELAELIYVDANNSEIVKTINKLHKVDVNGTVQGEIIPVAPTDTPELRNLPNLQFTIDGNQVTTDENGNFNYTISGSSANLNAGLNGEFVTLSNFNLPNVTISQTVQQNDVVNLIWDDSNSSMEERNVYYHINLIHQNNKLIDPNFTFLDYPLQCIVNDTGANAPCNAFWNGTNLHFGVQAASCSINSAHGASVIYHEYGHAINDHLYQQAGVSVGLRNPILHEAFSDIYATLLTNDPRFALGWFGPGTFTRNVNNNNSYPNSIVGQQHSDGLILGGTFWDLGLLTSPETAYELAHFAKYGTPDDSNIAVAFSEVYFETLVADDDDGNLMNGTPNSNEIDNAFCQHGIGSNLFVTQQLSHVSLENTINTTNDYQIIITIPENPFIATSLGNMNLIYSTNNFSSTQSTSLTVINNTTYEAFIPNQNEGSLVKYYFEIPNGGCGTQLKHPSRDFNNEYYSFYVGDYVTVFNDDFETNQNWTFGDATDSATSGFWQRGNPQQTIDDTGFQVQPNDDHSVTGFNCLVTGAFTNGAWFANDVDGGRTTVTSPVFSNLNNTSIVSFYKWFAHGAGFVFPANGRWDFQVSNNGATWTSIENTSFGDHKYWIKAQYKLSDYIAITNQMQVRFRASDFGTGSIVEALVDDFSIVNLNATATINDNELEDFLSLYPNPIDEILHIEFNNQQKFKVKIYDITGKIIHANDDYKVSYNWNSSNISKGIYFVLITTKTNKKIFKKVLIK